MEKSIKVIFSIIMLVVVFVFGFIMGNKKEVVIKPIKVGVLADLSGDYTSFLRGIVRGAEIAKEDMQKETKREIQLIIEDQKSCDVKETVTIMNKFVFLDEVDVVIGGSCTNTTLAAAPIAEKNKIILISPSSTAKSVSQAGEYIFRVIPSDALKSIEIARVAFSLGKSKMAIIIGNENQANFEAAEGAKDEFIRLGGEIVLEDVIEDKSSEVRTPLLKVRESEADVLLISLTSPTQIGLLLKQLKELGINIQVVHPMEAPENQEVVSIAKEASDGLIYVIQSSPFESKEFVSLKEKYKEKYNDDDIPQYLAESYDATVLGIKAILGADSGREDIKDTLYRVSKTYQGISGNIEFDENGDVTKPVEVKIIKNGEFVLYKQ